MFYCLLYLATYRWQGIIDYLQLIIFSFEANPKMTCSSIHFC